MNNLSALLQAGIVALAIVFALSYGNNVEPSDLLSNLSENVTIFHPGIDYKSVLPNPPNDRS